MADPNSNKPDQPAAAGRKPEDAAERLNEILSSPIENPFSGESPAAPVPADAAAKSAPPPDRTGSVSADALPPDLAAWQGAAFVPETARQAAAQSATEAVSAQPSAPAAQPAQAPAAPLDSAGSRAIAKVRRLMLVSTLLTALAIAAVFAVIGYRVFQGGESQPATQATLTLPPGAKIVQTAIAEDRIVLTLQVGGALEIRTYDLKTLKPLGRLNFSTVP